VTAGPPECGTPAVHVGPDGFRIRIGEHRCNRRSSWLPRRDQEEPRWLTVASSRSRGTSTPTSRRSSPGPTWCRCAQAKELPIVVPPPPPPSRTDFQRGRRFASVLESACWPCGRRLTSPSRGVELCRRSASGKRERMRSKADVASTRRPRVSDGVRDDPAPRRGHPPCWRGAYAAAPDARPRGASDVHARTAGSGSVVMAGGADWAVARIVMPGGYGCCTRPWSYRLSSGIGRASDRALAAGKQARGAGEAERGHHDRDDPEPPLARRRKAAWTVESRSGRSWPRPFCERRRESRRRTLPGASCAVTELRPHLSNLQPNAVTPNKSGVARAPDLVEEQ